MAYMSQEKKREINKNLKPILKKYGVKGSLSVNNHSTLVLTVRKGSLNPWMDVAGDVLYVSDMTVDLHVDVNPYHYSRHFTGRTLDFLTKAFAVMNDGNFDKSDIMTDYFHVGWYVKLQFGKWDKPYVLAA